MTSPTATLGMGLVAAACLLAGLALGRARAGRDGSPGAWGPWPRRLVGLGLGLLGVQTILLGLSITD